MEKINFVNKPNTTTPINDKNLNKMQENIEKEFSKLEVYSTEEKFTGKYWIDGKKIYRKSFSGKAVTDADMTISMIDANIDMITSINGYAHSFYGNAWPIPCYRNDGYKNEFIHNRNGQIITINFSTYYDSNCKYTLTIEYTKIND